MDAKLRRMLEKKLLQELLRGRRTKAEVAEALGVTARSIERYRRRFHEAGPARLVDGRASNYRKVTAAMEVQIVQAKRDGPHRSARFLRDLLRS